MESEKLYEELKSSILLYGRVIRPATYWAPPSEAHYRIEEVMLNPEKDKVNIICPRGLGKTTLAAEDAVMHHIFLEPEVQKVVVIISKTQSHSINRLRAIKNTIEFSEEFRSIHGYWGEHTAKVWRDNEIVLKNGSAIVAKGTGQPIKGLNYNSVRPTLIILDDPEDENNTKTPEAMNANLEWLLQGAVKARSQKAKHKAKIVVIGTPLNQRCMVETLKDAKGWHTVHFSYITRDEFGNERSIWPEVRTLASLYEEKEQYQSIGREYVWWKEVMCELRGREDQLFKEDDLKYWEGEYKLGEHGAYIETGDKKVAVNIFMGVDPASSTKSSADYSVIAVIGYTADDDIYLIDMFRKRVTPLDLADAFISMCKKYNPQKARIESTGYQEMLRQYVREKMFEEKLYIPGLEIKELPRSNKSARLESLQPRFAQRKVYLKREAHKAFADELMLFPYGRNDDTLDAFYYAQKGIYPATHVIPQDGIIQKAKNKIKIFRNNLEKSWMTA